MQIRIGAVNDQAELAGLGHVTRAQLTQIMNLVNLVPGIQEEVLRLPPIEHDHDRITGRDLQPIVAVSDWDKQRQMWNQMKPQVARQVLSSIDHSCQVATRPSGEQRWFWSKQAICLKMPMDAGKKPKVPFLFNHLFASRFTVGYHCRYDRRYSNSEPNRTRRSVRVRSTALSRL